MVRKETILTSLVSDVGFDLFLVYSIVENYGWYLLIGGIVLLVIYHKTLKAWIEKYREYRFEREYSAKYHKSIKFTTSYIILIFSIHFKIQMFLLPT